MGPKALRVTGELADGTIPYLAGPRTIGEFIVPTINKAAAEAGRPVPRVITAVPVLLSADVERARAAAAEQLSFYAAIPSYRNVIAREGVDSIAELAAVGPEEIGCATTGFVPGCGRHRVDPQSAGADRFGRSRGAMEAGCGSVRDWVLSYSTWNARRPSPGLMLDGDANAAPAPKIVAPVASTEKAMDMNDRFASTRLFAADELSTRTVMS